MYLKGVLKNFYSDLIVTLEVIIEVKCSRTTE